MLPIFIVYLLPYCIRIEALIIADLKLADSVESRQTYDQRDIILTEAEPTQFISSPGYPHELYTRNTQIEYEVKVFLSDELRQIGARIYFYFEVFTLELSQDCHKDGFEVMDNVTRQLRVYCGSQTGRSLVSEGDTVSLRFFSDAEYEEQGYRIKMSVYPSMCSQEFVDTNSGKFSSPNYPANYIKDDICVWRIVAPEGKYVRLKFDSAFDVQSPDEMCSQDHVLVSASGNIQKEFKRYCGKTVPGTIDSTTNVMMVVFRTDCCFQGKGFSATFGIIEKDPPTKPPPVVLPEGCKCGRSFVSEETRIVGGEEIDPPHKYPWVVGLVDPRNLLFCGAALISDQFVLTASHCCDERSPSQIRVVLGAHSRNITSESVLISVEEIDMHENYNGRTYFNDIALIRLSRKVEMTNEIYPLCLPPEDYQTDETSGVVVGWGRTSYAMEISQVLRGVEIPVVPNPKCIEIYGSRVLDTNVCAGETGKDACGGDSGGPFFSQTSDDRWMMVGIVSWGIGCGTDDNPGVFARVSEYRDWIYNRTGDLCVPEPPTVKPTLPPLPPPPLPNIKDCGIPNTNGNEIISRIVGGSETEPFEYPWIALIAYDGRIQGVGSLANRRYVLTSASCLNEWLIKNPEYIDVYLGKHDLYENEPYTEAHKVARVIVYPRYGEAASYDYDFALLELYINEDLPQKFRTICIPPFDMKVPDGEELFVAGWGRTYTNGRGSSVLMGTDLKLINWDTCRNIYNERLTRNMVCAGNTDKDACHGDSGAPLMMFSRGRYFLVGVMSWGPDEGCAIPGKPSVFSTTQRVRSWLTGYARLT